MIATDLTIADGDVALAATLTLPNADAPVPLVICLHGTGELDRDENHPAWKLDVFNAIADHLAARGIATLRYDKRGCGTDIQCDPADVALIAQSVEAPVTPVVIDDLTHILRKDAGEHSFISYKALLAQPVDEEVLRLVGDWLAGQAA